MVQVWSDLIRSGQIWSDLIRSDRSGQIRSDLVRCGMDFRGQVGTENLTWPDLIWSDLIWSDLIWSDQIWSGHVRSDQIRSDKVWSGVIKKASQEIFFGNGDRGEVYPSRKDGSSLAPWTHSGPGSWSVLYGLFAHLTALHFLIIFSMPFLIDFSLIFPPNLLPKIHQKTIKNRCQDAFSSWPHFLIDFWLIFAPNFEPLNPIWHKRASSKCVFFMFSEKSMFDAVLLLTYLHFPSQNPPKSSQKSIPRGIKFLIDVWIVFYWFGLDVGGQLEAMLATFSLKNRRG